MKIIYCIIDCASTGGMERIISCKANYLTDVLGHDVSIITTNQKGRENYYPFSKKIKFFDLGINYDELSTLPLYKRIIKQRKKRKEHKQKLAEILHKQQADIVISTYTHEFTLLPGINDGSKKIAEIHFAKDHSVISGKHKKDPLLQRIALIIGEKRKHWYIKKYERFVVLTKEDMKDWKHYSNIRQIYNVSPFSTEVSAPLTSKKVICVGRLVFQKGFDLLIESWGIIHQNFPDWHLDIFGTGDDLEELTELIQKKKLENIIKVNSPVKNIIDKYLENSIYVMSSRYEGFGMVLTEAMLCGLPCVSFNCPHGPSEIITDGEDGFIVPNGNISELANKIMLLMSETNLRIGMGKKAKENIKRFSPGVIMKEWENLFNELLKEKQINNSTGNLR